MKGFIKDKVYNEFIKYIPDLEKALKSFSYIFTVTWGNHYEDSNTQIYAFLLKPFDEFKTEIGVYREILLVYSPYDKMEARSIKAAENILQVDDVRRRADGIVYFLLTKDNAIDEWVENYSLDVADEKKIIPFSFDELILNSENDWFVRNKIKKYYLDKDLFNISLPVVRDSQFFGREDITRDLFDAIRASENRGIFGLRKTGKTSVVFKLQRMIENERLGKSFYYDCKTNSIRKSSWFEFLNKISIDIAQKFNLKQQLFEFSERNADDLFIKLIKQIKGNEKVVLIFDEVDFISPAAIRDKHWHKEFIEFWGTLWACQSVERKLIFIIVGVNPSLVEVGSVDGVQNPVFGIVSHRYLKGLNLDAIRQMITRLGQKMGLNFSEQSISYIYNRYGGHPLLTRMACSKIFYDVRLRGEDYPINIEESYLSELSDYWDESIVMYCSHITSELETFYKDEYNILENLSLGQYREVLNVLRNGNAVAHLEGYGLINCDNAIPQIVIPVIEKYIKREALRKRGNSLIFTVPVSQRLGWITSVKDELIKDIKFFSQKQFSKKGIRFYPFDSIPHGEKFIKIQLCADDEQEFYSFINVVYKSLVEPVEDYYKSSNSGTFHVEFKNEYPNLYKAYHRIKVYRNDAKHIKLTKAVCAALNDFLREDLNNCIPAMVEDVFFIIQRAIFDGILNAIAIENDRLDGFQP